METMHTRTSPKSLGRQDRKAPTLGAALKHFHAFQKSKGYPPSYEELASLLGKSKSVAVQTVKRLTRRGLLSNPTGATFRARTLTPRGVRLACAIERGEASEDLLNA